LHTRRDTRRPAAIVLVDHGSKRPAANALVEDLARRVQARRPECIVRAAHMELASPTLGEAIDACVAAGARNVVVHPYFLGPGRHSTRDIPEMASAAAARHPGVEVKVSEPLGLHEKLVDVVLDRVDACA
jgi:sirohydrochlorin ferrochelatase